MFAQTCVAGSCLTLRGFIQQPLIELIWLRTEHTSASSTCAAHPRTSEKVHKWEDFVPEARRCLGALDNTKRIYLPQVSLLMLVVRFAMQGTPVRVMMYLMQVQVIHAHVSDTRPLGPPGSEWEVRAHIFGVLQHLTHIAPDCGLREHLVLCACFHVPSFDFLAPFCNMQALAATICDNTRRHSHKWLRFRSLVR